AHQTAAPFTAMIHRLLPTHPVAVGVPAATVEGPPSPRLPLHDGLRALRARDPHLFEDRSGVAALGETGAGQKLAETTLLDHHMPAAHFTDLGGDDVGDGHLVDLLLRLLQSGFKGLVKLPDHLLPPDLSLLDPIELLFEGRGEFDVDDLFEVLFED